MLANEALNFFFLLVEIYKSFSKWEVCGICFSKDIVQSLFHAESLNVK